MTDQHPIVLLGSARRDGDTRHAIEVAFEGCSDCLDLQDYRFGGYDYTGANLGDDFLGIIDTVLARQTIVFATPVYWYAMSGLLKTFFDRLSDLITLEKAKGRALAGKSAWLIATGYDDELPDGFEVPFQRTCDYFDMTYRGAHYFCTNGEGTPRDAAEARLRDFGRQVLSTAASEPAPGARA